MAIIDDFKSRFPEFDDTFVDATLPFYIDNYQCYYGGDYSNACDKEIILYLLAHLLYTEGGYDGSGSGGATPTQLQASKSVGSVSVSYVVADTSTSSARNNFFGTTKYGQRYLLLTAHNFGAKFA